MPNWMPFRMAATAVCFSLAATAFAQDFTPAAKTMFRELREQPNDLARYMYLLRATPKLPVSDQPLALQMFASVENELGLYNVALRDFPLRSHVQPDVNLPTPAAWNAKGAADVIADMAANRALVMINEAHHDAHTRQLTLTLLPRLRALGFDYFAVEALSENGEQLMQRGYAVEDSGTEYLREPSYGEIVRTAIKLGFTVVAYDVSTGSREGRESGQADNLYRKTFARDPKARLFVHAGYAHIDKAKGRLGDTQPMAVYLQKLTGIEPMSIDQTQFREQIPAEQDAYRQLVTAFPFDRPFVLINRTTGKPWSDHPDRYDMNVLLPPAGSGIVDSGFLRPESNVRASDRDHLSLPDQIIKQRPNWLARRDDREPYLISSSMCKTTFPCVVDAHVINESADAIAADRYVFMRGDVVSKLYLKPGRYRLRAWGVSNQTLFDQAIEVGDQKQPERKPNRQ